MKAEHLLNNKKEMTIPRLKPIVSFFIIIVMIVPTISVQAEINKDHDHPEVYWKHYPYQPPGTEIIFPTDEGSHETSEFPIEWWYANFHLTGQTTGNEYGSFVAFYKIQTNIAEKKEIRIFSISDIAVEKTYTNVQIGTLTASTDHLDLVLEYITNDDKTDNQIVSQIEIKNLISENKESINTKYTETTMKSTDQSTTMGTTNTDTMQKTNSTNNYMIDYQESSDELIQYDHWYTKYNDHGLLPFQYGLEISGNSQQDSKPMKITVDMDCLKKPLIVGGDGVIELGKDQRNSFYYCLSKLAVVGSITLHGITEDITGFAWIDHQWGDFLNQNPPPCGLVVSYEWFSIKLDDNREILAGDTWDQETGERINQSFSNGINLLNSDGTLELLEDYIITPDSFWNDELTHRIFASKWHIVETSKSIDITITPLYKNQMMRVGEDYPAIRQILDKIIPGSCFWEGVCTVSGTINGALVQGKAYVELTHHYDFEHGK
jgi:predicted secreted hydrolase